MGYKTTGVVEQRIALLFTIFFLWLSYGCHGPNAKQSFDKGVEAFQTGDTVRAIKYFRVAVRRDPDFADAWYNLGVCYFTPRGRKQAVDYFRRAARLNPYKLEHHLALSQSLQKIDSLAAASQVLWEARKYFPHQPAVYFHLGYVYFLRAQSDSAIWAYRRSLELDPNNADAWYNLAYSMTGPERRRESIGYLRRAIELNPDKLEAHYLLAMRLLDEPNLGQREKQEALSLLRRYMDAGAADEIKRQRIEEKLSRAGLKL